MRRIRERVEDGEARSVSAFIAEAVEERFGHDDLKELLAEMREQFGPPTPEEQAWADELLAKVDRGQ
jgi:hypothetical protein